VYDVDVDVGMDGFSILYGRAIAKSAATTDGLSPLCTIGYETAGHGCIVARDGETTF